MATYKQLKGFITLSQSTSFADAADKMHVSQPALSTSIKNLEAFLGGELFSRNTRNLELSHEGQAFVPVARQLLNDWDNAIMDVQALFAMKRGKLTIAAMPSFASSLLPEILVRFRQQYPAINLTVRDVVMEQVITSVMEGRAELGFTFESEQLGGFEFMALFEDTFVVVMPPEHALSRHQLLDWDMILEHPFVAMNRGSTLRLWLDNAMHQRAQTLNIVAEAGQLMTLGEFVKHGMGISIVPGICKRQFTNNGLVCLPLQEDLLLRKVGVIRRINKGLSVPAQALWDQCVHFTQRLK